MRPAVSAAMFGVGLLAAFTVLLLYVAWRASSARGIAGRVRPKAILVAGALAWLAFLFGRFFARGIEGSVSIGLELAAFDSLIVLMLAAVCLLVVDVLTAFGRLLPRKAPTLRAGALVAALALSLVAVVQGMRPPTVSHYEVELSALPSAADGTVVVAMSDLHVGRLLDREWLAARVEQTQALRADVIVLLGDVFEGRSVSEDRLAPLAALSAPLGVWGVLGNHDRMGGRDRAERERVAAPSGTADEAGSVRAARSSEATDATEATALFERLGVHVLSDTHTELAPGLVLAGLTDRRSRRGEHERSEGLGRALTGRPDGALLLLSHAPRQVDEAARAGAGLMLAGHTHGGQVWPFGELVRLVDPYLAGRYTVQDMTLIVCRGTGTWGPRMRLWQPGEILHIVLRSADHAPE